MTKLRQADPMPLFSLSITTEEDVVATRRLAREVARLLEFTPIDQTKISTAVSEISRNAYLYANGGRARYSLDLDEQPQCLLIEIADNGPGIPNLDDVVQGNFTSRRGLGIGISGSKNLVEDFEIRSVPESGTYVRLRQPLPQSQIPLDSRQAVEIRKKLAEAAELNPLEELRQQNNELVTSLDTITRQRELIEEKAKALRESNNQRLELVSILNSALASLTEAVCVYDRDGEVMYRNIQCDSLLSHFNSHSLAEAFGLDEKLKRVIRTRQSYRPVGFDGVKRAELNGDPRVFLPSIVPMTDSRESASGAVLTLVDVTEFELIDQLKSDLIGTLSHEIKTPTTTVRMAIKLMLEEELGPISEQQRSVLEAASTEVERLLRILRNLLDLRRFSQEGLSLTTARVSPEEIVSSVVTEAKMLAQQSEIRIETELEEDLPKFEADPDRMIHALGNLVTNAILFSPPQSSVSIKAAREGDTEMSFRVIDRGKGIPEEFHASIFERFVRVPDNQVPGTGIGLYIAREFIQAQGGRISLSSEVGKGSEFRLTLPIDREQPAD